MLILNKFTIIALVLLLIGGLNWGTVGLFNIDLVALIFGQMTIIARVIYSLVGLAAIYLIFSVLFYNKKSPAIKSMR